MEGKSSEKNTKILIGGIIGVLVIVGIIFLLRIFATKKYTVTFDSNGGSIVESIEVKKNTKVKKPADPTKDGYTFGGWYLDDELFDFDTKITEDIILEAYWNSNNIELSSTNIKLDVGSEKKLDILSLPDGITKKDLVYSSSDKSIVTVDENGNLKALKTGTATITIKSKDGKYTASCTVTVTDGDELSIDGDSTVTVGSSTKLTVKFKSSDDEDQKLTWKSSDTSIATVDENGNVKALKNGTVTITVTTPDGKTAKKVITVKTKTATQNNYSGNSGNQQSGSSANQNQEVNQGGESNTPTQPATIEPSKVNISGANEVYVGKSINLTATVSPSNAENKNVTWKSSNSSIATVDGNGKVTGVSSGTVTITATTSNGKTATYKVTVKDSYVIYLTKRELAVSGGAIQYDFRVEKNNSTFTDYLGFTYNGTQVAKDQGSVASTAVSSGGKQASITLSNGTVVTATVLIR